MKKITDYLTEREAKILKRFSELQLDILSEGIDENINLISFDYYGMDITNPFVDESGIYPNKSRIPLAQRSSWGMNAKTHGIIQV